MNRLHYISTVMLIVAVFIFTSAYIYHQRLLGSEAALAKAVVSVTMTVLPASDLPNEPQLITSSYGVNEENAISMVIIVAVLMAGVVSVIAMIEKFRVGYQNMQVPLIALSMMLTITFVTTAIRTGLLWILSGSLTRLSS